jgi:transposase
VTLGRKNYLFAGSDAGGDRAAAMYSLLGTAKLNGHNPEAFRREVIARIADHPITRIHELLPWNHKATRAPRRSLATTRRQNSPRRPNLFLAQ